MELKARRAGEREVTSPRPGGLEGGAERGDERLEGAVFRRPHLRLRAAREHTSRAPSYLDRLTEGALTWLRPREREGR